MNTMLAFWIILATLNCGIGIKNSVDGSPMCILNWTTVGLCVFNIIKVIGMIG